MLEVWAFGLKEILYKGGCRHLLSCTRGQNLNKGVSFWGSTLYLSTEKGFTASIPRQSAPLPWGFLSWGCPLPEGTYCWTKPQTWQGIRVTGVGGPVEFWKPAYCYIVPSPPLSERWSEIQKFVLFQCLLTIPYALLHTHTHTHKLW